MITATGDAELIALSKALKAAGKDLDREVTKATAAAVKPFKAAAQASALATLPRRGGLAAEVAGSRFRISRRAGGVRVSAVNKYNIFRMNQGRIGHPGGSLQATNPGWWDKPAEELTPAARAEIEKALQSLAKRIDAAV